MKYLAMVALFALVCLPSCGCGSDSFPTPSGGLPPGGLPPGGLPPGGIPPGGIPPGGNPPLIPGACVSPIDLLTATSYAVLAGTTVTNTGPTTLSGDLGLHPGAAVTGAPIVTGVTNIANAPALQAKNDLITAYNAAAAATSTQAVAGDIGGQTLIAGVYTSTSSLLVQIGDLTLVGGPNDVFIFQMASSLTVSPGRRIILQGVRSCNVIWQVGSSATLDTGVQFVGTILALTSITLNTGATVDGRILARNGQVALDTNLVTVP